MWSLPSAAQTFPTDYVALPCGAGVMSDAAGDTPNATGGLDLVGSPAGLHAADANFLYLRMRVAADPRMGGRLQPNAWGYELDLDGNRNTYELLFSLSGLGANDEVAVYRHPTTQTPGNPAEAAAAPPAFTYPASTHSQVIAAGGGNFFLDIALPWADLATVNVMKNSAVGIWAGSSTVANALDLDLACFGGAGGTLGGIDVGMTTPDPRGGGTTNGGGPGPRTLEGGPGCAMVGGGGDGAAIMTLLLLLWICRRRIFNPCRR